MFNVMTVPIEYIEYKVTHNKPDLTFVVSWGDSLKQEQKEANNTKTSRANSQPTENQRLYHYLENAISSYNLSRITAKIAMDAWLALDKALSYKLIMPNAGVGPDGEVMYTWDSPEHHLELEIFPEGAGEFFYLNRKTDDTEEWEYTIGKAIPKEVIEKLNLF